MRNFSKLGLEDISVLSVEKRLLLNRSGFGLVVVLMWILGVSLVSATIAINVLWLQAEEGVTATQRKLQKLALLISSTSSTGPNHYEQNVGALPDALTDLMTNPGVAACSLATATGSLSGWCGPYWTDTFQGESSFQDSWGRNIVYSKAGRSLKSLGPNGVDNAGGTDDIVQTF